MNASPPDEGFNTDDPVDDMGGGAFGAGSVSRSRRLLGLCLLFAGALSLVEVTSVFSQVPGVAVLGGILAIVLPVTGVLAERRVRRAAKRTERHSLDPV